MGQTKVNRGGELERGGALRGEKGRWAKRRAVVLLVYRGEILEERWEIFLRIRERRKGKMAETWHGAEPVLSRVRERGRKEMETPNAIEKLLSI